MRRNEGITIGNIIIVVAIIVVVLVIGVTLITGEKEEDKTVGNTNIVEQGSEVKEETTNKTEEKYTEELKDGTQVNVSEELNKTKTYKNLEIKNIQYTEKNNKTMLKAEVTNKGTTKHEAEIVKIILKGKDGETIAEIKPVIGEIEAGQTIKMNATITADVVNIKDMEIKEMK